MGVMGVSVGWSTTSSSGVSRLVSVMRPSRESMAITLFLRKSFAWVFIGTVI